MRKSTRKSGNKLYYSIIKDINIDGKRTTEVYENLGTIDQFKSRAGNEDPLVWLKNYIDDINNQAKEKTLPVIITKDPSKLIEKNHRHVFNCGYLFLQDIYYNLGLNKICAAITDKYQFKFDLNSILSALTYSRIIYPSSKLKTYELSKRFIEKPNFDLHQIYRALEVIAKEKDFIQSELYKNSVKAYKRNNNTLYYDCTNYYFEIEMEDGDKQFGISKENKPNPIVQMGLFMDGDGIPLAFDMTAGNVNEQKTLQPLEEKILKDFDKSNIVVCTDAGLASTANRKFNNTNNRKFITTQSLKKLKGYLKGEALDLSKGWKIPGSDKTYNIEKLRTDPELIEKFKDTTFYKERWIKEDGLEQRLIVTYSVKYQEYQKTIREKQIERAMKLLKKKTKNLGKARQNDPKRFITAIQSTENGEVAENTDYSINYDLINEEAKYDGLYGVCTNLEDEVTEIIKVNHRRWEIEESFRIMKSDFKARPIYLTNDDRITAHFTTCFIALIILRYLEKLLDGKYTSSSIIETLRSMELRKEKDQYLPNYIRTDLTDSLHEKFNFRTDYEVISEKNINKICKQVKK